MSISARVKARRQELKLTQQQLAEQVGVTRSAVTQLEKGMVRDPRPEHLLRYAKALRMPVEELVHGHGGALRAEVPGPVYASLSPPERLLIDYIRASGGDAAQRDSLARTALALLVAVATQPLDDARLPPQWDARNRKPTP